jgi:hypothetical protein
VLHAYAEGVALVAPGATNFLPERDPACPSGRDADAKVAVTEDRPGSMRFSVASSYPGIIVIPDNFDAGWRASVNGGKTPVLKAYHAYIGIPVNSGRSTIQLTYSDIFFGWDWQRRWRR